MKYQGIELKAKGGSGLRFLPGADGRLLSTNDEHENPITYVTRSLYDAIPRVAIDLRGIPEAEDLWAWLPDDDEPCELAEEWLMEGGRVTTVYFILNAQTGMIKIGYTSNLKSRLSTYRGHNPGELEVYSVPGNRRLERALLTRFKPVRRSGEWFYPHPALISYVQGSI